MDGNNIGLDTDALPELSRKVLISLYADKRLALTPAISELLNRTYPSNKEIIYTLDKYKDVDIVIEFEKTHSMLLSEVRNQLVNQPQKKQEISENIELNSKVDSFADIFSSNYDSDVNDLYAKSLKKFSILQIEQAIGNALAELTGTIYTVDISKADYYPEKGNWLTDVTYLELKATKTNRLASVKVSDLVSSKGNDLETSQDALEVAREFSRQFNVNEEEAESFALVWFEERRDSNKSSAIELIGLLRNRFGSEIF